MSKVASDSLALPTLDDIVAAQRRIAPYVIPTPVVVRDGLACKFEFVQHTGSFKPRGAFNAALQMTNEERARGLVAVSGGNHGMGVAYVARVLEIAAVIVMPKTTPAFVIDAVTRDGAEVVLTETIAEAFARTAELTAAGRTLLHPFDDARVIAGQGTVGLEIVDEYPAVDTIVASIGGGGLLVGIAIAAKARNPAIRVIGVETKGADAMALALAAGEPVTLPAITSIARTLGAPAVSPRTLDGMRRHVDESVVIDDRDAVAAIVELQQTFGVVVEPAAACTYAALRLGHVAGKHPLLVLCGRNVRLDEIAGWRERFGA
jgi:threonine dehydratase